MPFVGGLHPFTDVRTVEFILVRSSPQSGIMMPATLISVAPTGQMSHYLQLNHLLTACNQQARKVAASRRHAAGLFPACISEGIAVSPDTQKVLQDLSCTLQTMPMMVSVCHSAWP